MSRLLTSNRSLWMVWGALVTCVIGLAGVFGNAVLAWPQPVWLGFAVGALSIPFAGLLGASRRFARHARGVLAATIVLAGLLALVCGLYLGVLVAFGRQPEGAERDLLAFCILATLVACALVTPVRERLRRWAADVVDADRPAPEEVLATFGGRMTRAMPMDELLLQVVETLHKALRLSGAEVWTVEQGCLVRVAALPERGPDTLVLDPDVGEVTARSHTQGNAWLSMWIPGLLTGRDEGIVRSASISHRGELLGLMVLERPVDGEPFTPDQDRMLVDLARQLGLALHNVRLDSALQTSVDQLEERNAELTASRSRIVAVADESRQNIERDLHDGAQQHLVALAVKVGLIRSSMNSDREVAIDMLDELADDVTATIEELRELAHGIYPPRLRDRGLAAALATAATRAPCPTTVVTNAARRYPADVEAAVYFCCLEAIQNAGKYGGEHVSVEVRLDVGGDRLRFEVDDDGPGFDPGSMTAGQGLTNMRDRVGALGGTLTVESQAGKGTIVAGAVPVRPIDEMLEINRSSGSTPRAGPQG